MRKPMKKQRNISQTVFGLLLLPSFLAEMTDFDQEVFEAIADNGKCESNNDVIYNTIKKTCGIDTFVEAAISADGRGHFMSSYDGNENEETVTDEFGTSY